MKQLFKNIFALTDQGAADLVKATWSSFFVYCINMLPAFILLLLIDQLHFGNQQNPWVFYSLALGTLVLLYWCLSLEYDRTYNTTYQESAQLRTQIAEDLSNLPLSYFSKHNLSDLSQTIMSDVEGIEHALSHMLAKFGAMLIFFPLVALMLLLGNVKLGLAVIVPNLLSLGLVVLSKRNQAKGNNLFYQTLRDNSEQFQETIEMQQEINSFNLGTATREKLFKRMEESEVIHLKVELKAFSIMALSTIISYTSLAIVMLVGTSLMLQGEVNLLYALAYLLVAIRLKDAVDVTKEGLLEIYAITPKIQRIKALKQAQVQVGEPTTFHQFDIELNDVTFAYESQIPVLQDISFVAKQGEVTALVGASGCGKTSVLRLMSRLYDYDQGNIQIDNYELNGVATDSLFSQISIVFQNVTLFNTSVMENIRIGNQQASDEDVRQAARLANCHQFIDRLPEGYQTLIGENGSALSGGERQRISIARAFLKNAPILILDEITASLDVENENQIQESLNRLIKNKTVLIISHRLKSIENVDKIIVLEQGKVVNQGTHGELIRRSDVYQNLLTKTKLSEEFVY